MELALQCAREALDRREVPVGCVFMLGSVPIATGGNRTNEFGNATRHAELVALDTLHQEIANTDNILLRGKSLAQIVKQCDLYVTVEPCVMCAAALAQLQIASINYGCGNDKFGGCGSVLNVVGTVPVVSGIRSAEAVALLQQFYERDNPQSKAILENVIMDENPAKRSKTDLV